MQDIINFFTKIVFHQFMILLLIISIFVIVNAAFSKILKLIPYANIDTKRRMLLIQKNITFLIFIITLFITFGDELKSFALSIATVAVAFILFFKELITCLMGTLVKTVSFPFGIGDTIEVLDAKGSVIKGQVVGSNLFSTTILEVEKANQFSGKTVNIPNSAFISSYVKNASVAGTYVFNILIIPVSEQHALLYADIALEETEKYVADYLTHAEYVVNRVQKQQFLDMPSVKPRVSFEYTGKDTLNIVCRYPVPSHKKVLSEQTILRNFLTRVGPKTLDSK